MINCKHCGKEIIKCNNRWYHVKGSRWFCSTKKATPSETPSKEKGK